MKPIYEPKGRAKEYCEWALNIYTGCPHRCFYCYCPQILRRDREDFFSKIEPRRNIVEETRKQLEHDGISGKLIQLCFVGDPYPTGYDTTPTREIIKLLKQYGNHVQILTKGNGSRDFDLLDSDDWYGVTIDGSESTEEYVRRLFDVFEAHKRGIKTWLSLEPVLDANRTLNAICAVPREINKIKIGNLNYHPSNINWKAFGIEAEKLCNDLGVDYYIKESLRAEMNKP